MKKSTDTEQFFTKFLPKALAILLLLGLLIPPLRSAIYWILGILVAAYYLPAILESIVQFHRRETGGFFSQKNSSGVRDYSKEHVLNIYICRFLDC